MNEIRTRRVVEEMLECQLQVVCSFGMSVDGQRLGIQTPLPPTRRGKDGEPAWIMQDTNRYVPRRLRVLVTLRRPWVDSAVINTLAV